MITSSEIGKGPLIFTSPRGLRGLHFAMRGYSFMLIRKNTNLRRKTNHTNAGFSNEPEIIEKCSPVQQCTFKSFTRTLSKELRVKIVITHSFIWFEPISTTVSYHYVDGGKISEIIGWKCSTFCYSKKCNVLVDILLR